MLTLVLAATVGFTPADFFPLSMGRRAVFEERSVVPSITTDVVSETVTIGGRKAVKVTTFNGSEPKPSDKPISTAFYAAEADAVYLVSYSTDDPLPLPMPILKVGEKKLTWDYEGPASSNRVAEPVKMKSESQLLPPRDVLGSKVDILEVKSTATMGAGAARETIEQRSTYAKGIGLIELTSKTTVGKRSVESSLKLIKVQTPGGS